MEARSSDSPGFSDAAESQLFDTAVFAIRNDDRPRLLALITRAPTLARLVDAQHRSLLLHAAMMGRFDMLPALLALSDAHVVDASERTALIHAAVKGSLECVSTLLPHSDPLHRDFRGHTALAFAILEGHTTCVMALANIESAALCNDLGLTPLMMAATQGDASMVDCLLPLSDAKALNRFGNTALMNAVLAGHADCVRLLGRTHDLGWTNASGESVWTLANKSNPDLLNQLMRAFSAHEKDTLKTALTGGPSSAPTNSGLMRSSRRL